MQKSIEGIPVIIRFKTAPPECEDVAVVPVLKVFQL